MDKSKWWSPFQQYSPPGITYVAAPVKGTAYACCDFEDNGSVMLAQVNGWAIEAKINLTGLTAGSENRL